MSDEAKILSAEAAEGLGDALMLGGPGGLGVSASRSLIASHEALRLLATELAEALGEHMTDVAANQAIYGFGLFRSNVPSLLTRARAAGLLSGGGK
jgi:hypothetical protein